MIGHTRHPASYRDPSGFIYKYNGKIYRQVNNSYADNYQLLINSDLYAQLTEDGYLLSHTEINENYTSSEQWNRTLLPEQIPLITYPYEWSFEQMKDAALLTLRITKLAMEKGMILKDATPFNIQFINGRPVHIDTLSFEKYDPLLPWIAYRQFCETFIFPLWLSHYHKANFQNLLNIYPEGIPVSLAANLFPVKSRFNLAVWLHVHLQNKFSNVPAKSPSTKFSEKKLLNIITHLESIIQKLQNNKKTAWSRYYDEGISSPVYLDNKEKIILDLLGSLNGKYLLDMGSNDGRFSLLAAAQGFEVVAFDSDDQSIGKLYTSIKNENIRNILPLCIDITNPPGNGGFNNEERRSWQHRMKFDIVMVLALLHHLVIGKNLPLWKLAEYFSSFSPVLVIEFVPKDDEKTQVLLRNKKDIYEDYTVTEFEKRFQSKFSIIEKIPVADSQRVIYLMTRLNN